VLSWEQSGGIEKPVELAPEGRQIVVHSHSGFAESAASAYFSS
jgi:predicted protein tyrosine phosphatase